MPCEVTITEVTGITGPGSSTSTEAIRVSGTALDCKSIILGSGSIGIQVTIDCGGGPIEAAAEIVGGEWTVLIPTVCQCGGRIVVRAVCITNPDCLDTFDGPLVCEEGVCPQVDIDIAIGECNPDGTRAVTLTANVTAMGTAGTVVAEWDYGDGTTGSAFVISAPGSYTEGPHSYLPPGPFPARLTFVLPEECLPIEAEVDLNGLETCPGAACPEIDDVTVVAGRLCNEDSTRTVSFDAVISGGTPQTYHWDFGTPDSATATVDATVPGATPAVTHDYPAPGAGVSAYTATFTVTGSDPSCVDTRVEPVSVPGCGGECPAIEDVSATPGDCSDDTHRQVTLDATLAGGGFTEYQWNFGDGTSQIIDATITSDPSTTHTYDAPGTYTSTLTTVGPGGCDNQTSSVTVDVASCGEGDENGDGGNGGACGSLVFIVAALLVLAAGATIFTLALSVCPALMVPVPGWVWGIVAGLWVAAAASITLWYVFCAFGICDCPTACDWLAIGWMTSLASATVALFLAGCCVGWWWALVIGLAVAFVGAFVAWLAECDPTLCQTLDYLLVTFATVAATAITYIAIVPVIMACGLTWVEVAVATIVAALAISVPTCHSME